MTVTLLGRVNPEVAELLRALERRAVHEADHPATLWDSETR